MVMGAQVGTCSAEGEGGREEASTRKYPWDPRG